MPEVTLAHRVRPVTGDSRDLPEPRDSPARAVAPETLDLQAREAQRDSQEEWDPQDHLVLLGDLEAPDSPADQVRKFHFLTS